MEREIAHTHLFVEEPRGTSPGCYSMAGARALRTSFATVGEAPAISHGLVTAGS